MPRILLAVESSTDWLSVALFKGEELLVLKQCEGSRLHASALLPAIDEVLSQEGIGLDQLDAIGIATGPGSFTSLRIGLATVKGLALGRSILAVGVSTLEAMALGFFDDSGHEGEREVVTLLDARRGEWYAAAWTRPEVPTGLPKPTIPEGLYATTKLAELRGGQAIVMTPDTAAWRKACDRTQRPAGRLVAEQAARPRADAVGRLAARRLRLGEGVPMSKIEARYVRRAEAEAQRLGTPVEDGEVAEIGKVEEPRLS
ncbi:MAG: tRNA (adenosine(37)-N6)-threonylcarbamoyltransferase complex dimerization subunit type 1 TsaB [Myxococcota bacterium]